MQISRTSQTPIFSQIGDTLRQQIKLGELMPGDPVPSERELAEQLKVSRMTVRAAMNKLVQEGLLLREHGRKTIVADTKLNRDSGFTSFSEDMRARGLTPQSKVRELRAEMAEASIAAQLGLIAGERVIYLERLRLANQEPVAIERVYLPYERFAELLNKTKQLTRDSLYKILEQDFDCRPTFANETVEAVLLSSVDAKLFGLGSCAPALLAQRVTRDERGEPIETVQTLYRADRYRMSFFRKR